jgi:glutamate-1-semialdehyde 2,1-aminomutase
VTPSSGQYSDRTPTSRKWFERAGRVLPGGVSYAIRDIPPYPFYVTRAAGSRVFDADGNAWTDYWMGHGAHLLGHAPAVITEAVSRQVCKGAHVGYAHPLEVELAELVTRMVPCAELLRYTNSGTEANMYMLGLARCFTRRTHVAKIEGGWHGGSDALQKAVHAPFNGIEAAGLSQPALEDTLVVPFNDLDAARATLAGGDVACLILEPMLGAAGFIPPEPGYLAGLRALCTQTGTLLVFDEVITGFRLARGGAQEYFGVTPDLAVLGKIAGGGLPIGIICGRREVLERLDHRRFPAACERAFHGGTFSGNPLTMAAGLAMLKALDEGEVYATLQARGDRARSRLHEVFARRGIPAAMTGLGSMIAVHFQEAPPRNARDAARSDAALARQLHAFLLARGISYLTPAMPHFFLSTAHTDEDLERLVDAADDFAGTVA